MKLNQRIFWISLTISIITLIISIVLTFTITKNNFTEFSNGILMNIFAGTIVLVITSIYEYEIRKKELLEEMMLYCIKMKNIFSKLEYFEDVEFSNFEDYKNKFEKIIDVYIQIADGEYNDFWKCYANLEFIWDYKNQEKNKIYNDLFYYIYNEKINKIREAAFHFKEYKNAKHGNLKVNKIILVELQKEIFYFEEYDLENNDAVNSGFLEQDTDVCLIEIDNESKKYRIIANKITKHLTKVYDYIENIVYKEVKK